MLYISLLALIYSTRMNITQETGVRGKSEINLENREREREKRIRSRARSVVYTLVKALYPSPRASWNLRFSLFHDGALCFVARRNSGTIPSALNKELMNTYGPCRTALFRTSSIRHRLRKVFWTTLQLKIIVNNHNGHQMIVID